MIDATCPAAESTEDGARPPTPNWHELVDRIRRGDAGGMEQLYILFSGGIRFYLCRQLGAQELEDKIHDTFVIVVQAIRRGDLREPDRLMGFVRTIVRRQVAAFIESAIQTRRDQADLESGLGIYDGRSNPEENAIARQHVEIMKDVLRSISARDRDILTRFYLLNQTQQQICSEMGLNETQFRLLKSRAKARFGELGRRSLRRRRSPELLLRISSRTAH